ncbi:MAG: type II toxin-antitoxin system Phd/YefM family antitoxin [Rhodospirillales bacterium]|nr:type II toxin-antitoxin system Phd/YefM family antitoxin [Rhodospirillales bacterium]
MTIEAREISATDARAIISEIVNEAAYGSKRTIITKHGQGKAAVVPIEDFEILKTLDDILDIAEAKQAMIEAKREGSVGWDDLKDELGLE